MIETIKMRNCASYDGKGTEIRDCKKVNFIYGANGSGKSTISYFLNGNTPSTYADCTIDYTVSSSRNLLVYNKRFKESNIVSNGIPGIFTVGSDIAADKKKIVDLMEEMKELKNQIGKYQNSLNEKKQKKAAALTKAQNQIWNTIYQGNKDDFNEIFTGVKNSKEKLYSKYLEFNNLGEYEGKTYENLLKEYNLFFGKRLEECQIIPLFDKNKMTRLDFIESALEWERAIVGNDDIDVGQLIKALNNADWVSVGRKYIKGSRCPFCQEDTLTTEYISKLENYFSKAYEQSLNRVKDNRALYIKLVDEYKTWIDIAININKNNTVKFMDENEFKNKISDIFQHFLRNQQLMQDKINAPSTKIAISKSWALLVEANEFIDVINKSIEEYNDKIKSQENTKSVLKKEIWHYLCNKNYNIVNVEQREIKSYDKAIDGLNKKINVGNNNLNRLKNEILELNQKMTSVLPTIEAINKRLKSFGFNSFKIVKAKENETYCIQRENGSIVENDLSEGEETFLSFLYFMEKIKEKERSTDMIGNRIVVIDDPISSLDSNVLYIVSALIKDLINKMKNDIACNVEQLFVLTHNVFFYKEVSFVDGRSASGNKDYGYWIIRKDNNISRIKAYKDNPIKTSYELLWQEYRDNDELSMTTMQNIMRRILENYFKILGNMDDKSIEMLFENLEERHICTSLLYWINDGSHSIMDDCFIMHSDASVENYKKVFKEIFYKSGNQGHYDMMMRL